MEKTVMPLSLEQRERLSNYIVDDENLERIVRWIIGKTFKFNRITDDIYYDYCDVVFEGLCKAAKNYNPDKGMKFDTFCILNAMSALKSELRNENRLKRKSNKMIVSFSFQSDTDESDEKYYNECVYYDEYNMVDGKLIKLYYDSLSPLSKAVFRLILKGKTASEIQEQLNISKSKYEIVLDSLFQRNRIGMFLDTPYGKIAKEETKKVVMKNKEIKRSGKKWLQECINRKKNIMCQ